MKRIRRLIFWLHLALGILTGFMGALMAGTAVIMAFADSYLDLREYAARHVTPSETVAPRSLRSLAALVAGDYSDRKIIRIGLDRQPTHAVEFYLEGDGLVYADPYQGALQLSDSVPLRRTLHKGVEQWHRFLGRSGEARAQGKLVASWFNAALIPLLLTGLFLWWPKRFRWPLFRAASVPAGSGRNWGTQRSWHTSLGFWSLPFLLIMVLTATTHSFEWVRGLARNAGGSEPAKPASHDQLWAPELAKRDLPDDAEFLTLDELRAIADRELPDWTRLDLFPASLANHDRQTSPAKISGKVAGWGPAFFPVTLQLDPVSGDILDRHSWKDLSGGTRLLAWSRWLHKGDAFGRTGQIVAGLACVAMIVLIATGWILALRRLCGRRHFSKPGDG